VIVLEVIAAFEGFLKISHKHQNRSRTYGGLLLIFPSLGAFEFI